MSNGMGLEIHRGYWTTSVHGFKLDAAVVPRLPRLGMAGTAFPPPLRVPEGACVCFSAAGSMWVG